MTNTTTLNLHVPEAGPFEATATQRVLHVINGEHYSGAERVQDLLAQELPQFGFEVGFACLKPDRFPQARQAQKASLHSTPMRWRFDTSCVQKLVQLIQREKYALVHAHTPRSVLIGSLVARRANVPLVYHVHSPTSRDSTRRIQNWVNALLERWSVRNASKLIAVSPSLKQMIEEQGFAAEQVTYIPNGVPSQPLIERQRPQGVWTLGIAALFRPRKGIEVLLESLAMLRSRDVQVQLRAVGPFETPEYETEVRRLVDRLGIGNLITWTGFVSDVPDELRQMDLMVLPSLFGEGLPMVILEAMAAGLPVIASHVEGVPEAIVHRENGLLVEPASVSQLANAIEQIVYGDLNDTLDYVQLCENAYRRHAERFSAQAMAAKVAEAYQGILNDAR